MLGFRFKERRKNMRNKTLFLSTFLNRGFSLMKLFMFSWSTILNSFISYSLLSSSCLILNTSLLFIPLFYYYSLIRAFHISVSRWFFPGDWVTASILKSPGHFSVFWPFSIMLSCWLGAPRRPRASPPLPFIIRLFM